MALPRLRRRAFVRRGNASASHELAAGRSVRVQRLEAVGLPENPLASSVKLLGVFWQADPLEGTNLVLTLSFTDAEIAEHRVGIENVFFHRLFSRFCAACLSSARCCSSGKSARVPCRA
jgi:hypothetical protein